LTFEYTFEYPNDKVFFAYSEPYTFSQLSSFLQQFNTEQQKLEKDKQFIKFETLCKSLSGIEIPLLTITNSINEEKICENSSPPSEEIIQEIADDENNEWSPETRLEFKHEAIKKCKSEKKKILLIAARIHPGETCGSHMLNGFMKFITSNDPNAVELRSKLIIKVVPMMNVDGVIMGNYRGCLTGQDLNRKFADPDTRINPGICAVKKLLRELQQKNKDIFGYIDLHGHSSKKCVFIYGPYYPLHMDQYVRVRILAKLLSDRTQMFRYPACKFRQEPSKMNAARLVISREFDVVNSLTLEASFYGFINNERKTIEMSVEFYEKMGSDLGNAILEHIHLLEEERVMRIRRIFENNRRRKIIAKGKTKHKYQKESPDMILSKKSQLSPIGHLDIPKKTAKKLLLGEFDLLGEQNLNDEDIQVQNPNEPGEKKIIRLEECYQNPEAFTEVNERKVHKIKDIFKSIKEDIKREELEESPSDGSSSESEECDTLTKEEEANVIGNILSAMQGFSQKPTSNNPSEKTPTASIPLPKNHDRSLSKSMLSSPEKPKESPHHIRRKTQKIGNKISKIDSPQRVLLKPAYACFQQRQINCVESIGLRDFNKDYSFPKTNEYF